MLVGVSPLFIALEHRLIFMHKFRLLRIDFVNRVETVFRSLIWNFTFINIVQRLSSLLMNDRLDLFLLISLFHVETAANQHIDWFQWIGIVRHGLDFVDDIVNDVLCHLRQRLRKEIFKTFHVVGMVFSIEFDSPIDGFKERQLQLVQLRSVE